jgi:hypothetical protein
MDSKLRSSSCLAIRIAWAVFKVSSLAWSFTETGPPCAAQLPRDSSIHSRVHLVITDNFGHVLDVDGRTRLGGRITLRRQDSVVSANTAEPLNLEFGEYEVQVQLPGFKTSLTNAVISQPEQVIRIAMHIGAMDFASEPCSMEGRVSPIVNGVTIRLLELFGSTLVDVPMKSDGSFKFLNLECGDYMLMAVAPTGCLGLQFVRVPKEPGNKEPARIQLRLGNQDRSQACAPASAVR